LSYASGTPEKEPAEHSQRVRGRQELAASRSRSGLSCNVFVTPLQYVAERMDFASGRVASRHTPYPRSTFLARTQGGDMPMRSTYRAAILIVLTAATVQAHPNHAADHARSAASIVAWKPRPWTPGSQAMGLVISIDPVDGARGMPAPGELGPFARVADDAPVATFRRANGSVRATLDERFAEFAVVRLGADGKPVWTCVHGTKGAAAFMSHPTVNTNPAPPAGTVWEDK